MILSKCVVCDSKKSRFIKEQEDGPFTKNKEEYNALKKQVVQVIFIKTKWIKLAFNMT